jgi:hypothetical protein
MFQSIYIEICQIDKRHRFLAAATRPQAAAAFGSLAWGKVLSGPNSPQQLDKPLGRKSEAYPCKKCKGLEQIQQ